MRTLFVFSIIALGVLLPVLASAQGITLNLDYPVFGGIDLNTQQNINAIVGWLYYGIVGIAGLAAFVMLVWGGVQWLVSGAIPSQLGEAKDKLRAAILGLLLVLASFLIMQIINPELTNLNQPALQRFQDSVVPTDGVQGVSPQCSDGKDNDGNGDVDLADPDCANDPNGTSEGIAGGGSVGGGAVGGGTPGGGTPSTGACSPPVDPNLNIVNPLDPTQVGFIYGVGDPVLHNGVSKCLQGFNRSGLLGRVQIFFTDGSRVIASSSDPDGVNLAPTITDPAGTIDLLGNPVAP